MATYKFKFFVALCLFLGCSVPQNKSDSSQKETLKKITSPKKIVKKETLQKIPSKPLPLWRKTEKGYLLNFDNMPLELFVEFIAKATKKQILYDPNVREKKINLILKKTIAKNALFSLFKAVIAYKGYVLETRKIKDHMAIIVRRKILPPWGGAVPIIVEKEEFISKAIELDYVSAREIQWALRILNPQDGNSTVITPHLLYMSAKKMDWGKTLELVKRLDIKQTVRK